MKIKDRIKSLRRVTASELLPNPRNWRSHPKNQHDAMRGILGEIGFADAVLARETTEGLMLIDGHLRAEVAPEAKVPVLVLDVSEDEANKILATHDPICEMANADQEKLGDLLSQVKFDSKALEEMCNKAGGILREAEEVEAQVDRAEELQKEWKTEAGQEWTIKGKQTHRLVCGDSTDAATVKLLLAGSQPRLMVTDPPYGVEYDPQFRQETGLNKNGRYGEVLNDDRVDWSDAYKLFPGDVAYVWHAGRYGSEVAQSIEKVDFEIRSQLIWNKSRFAISRGHYHWKHEPCWYAVRRGAKASWKGDRTQSTVWDIAPTGADHDNNSHGTQKPVECMARPIRNHETDAVYDPFLGSGTTMVAAEQLGVDCYGLELSPAYCAVILERMKTMGCECVKAGGSNGKARTKTNSNKTAAPKRGVQKRPATAESK